MSEGFGWFEVGMKFLFHLLMGLSDLVHVMHVEVVRHEVLNGLERCFVGIQWLERLCLVEVAAQEDFD